MARLIFGLARNLLPSEVIKRSEVATAFGELEHYHRTQKDGKSVAYFYTDAPLGWPHDSQLVANVHRVLEKNHE